jgi:CheY-like chemotaxis protein
MDVLERESLRFDAAGHDHSLVLLIEPDRATAEMYRLGLLHQGFDVELAADGDQGIRRILEGRLPDVVVLDLAAPQIDRRLPGQGGCDLLETLLSIRLTEAMPVVAIADEGRTFGDALARGVTAGVAKWRVTPRQLAGVIAGLVRRPKGRP